MNNKQSLLFACIAFVISALQGCATSHQPPVTLRLSESVAPQTRIAVAATPIPRVNTLFPGANCLLCLAFAEASNGSLTKHIQSLPPEGLPEIKDAVANLLRKQGAAVTVIQEPLDLNKLSKNSAAKPPFADIDFSSLKKRYDADKLVVIQVQMVGSIREYHAYVPQGAPRLALTGRGLMVNLANNTYEWYENFAMHKSAEGNWDEPPNFPGMTNAYFQMLEEARQAILKPFRDDLPRYVPKDD